MQRKRVDEQQAWLEKERQKHNAERELAALNARRKSERTHAEIAKWAEKLAKPNRAEVKKELARRAEASRASAAALMKTKPNLFDGSVSSPQHRSSPSLAAPQPGDFLAATDRISPKAEGSPWDRGNRWMKLPEVMDEAVSLAAAGARPAGRPPQVMVRSPSRPASRGGSARSRGDPPSPELARSSHVVSVRRDPPRASSASRSRPHSPTNASSASSSPALLRPYSNDSVASHPLTVTTNAVALDYDAGPQGRASPTGRGSERLAPSERPPVEYGDRPSSRASSASTRSPAAQSPGGRSSVGRSPAAGRSRPSSAGAAVTAASPGAEVVSSTSTPNGISHVIKLDDSPAVQTRLLELRSAIKDRPWLPLSVKIAPYQRLLSRSDPRAETMAEPIAEPSGAYPHFASAQLASAQLGAAPHLASPGHRAPSLRVQVAKSSASPSSPSPSRSSHGSSVAPRSPAAYTRIDRSMLWPETKVTRSEGKSRLGMYMRMDLSMYS